MIEPKYVITRKTAQVGVRFENYYRVIRGTRKVCEVWAPSGSLRKSYDQKGKLIRDAGSKPTLPVSGPRFTLAFMLLRDAFDLKTAMEWAGRIEIKVPEDPSRYTFAVSVISYTKADLFETVLEARRQQVAR